MLKNKKTAKISERCVACGTCLKVCMFNAIAIEKGIKAVVGEGCVACGKCKMVCPANVITMVLRGDASE